MKVNTYFVVLTLLEKIKSRAASIASAIQDFEDTGVESREALCDNIFIDMDQLKETYESFEILSYVFVEKGRGKD